MPQKASVIDLLKWWLSKHGFGDLRAVQPVSSTDASLLGVRATPMLVAAALGQLGICESLVEHGAQGDVCSKCNFDRTCLAYACKGGHLEVAKFLVENGARKDLSSQCHFGCSCLFLACSAGKLEIVKWLVEEGARCDIFTLNSTGQSPLHTACAMGHEHVAQWLLLQGAANDQRGAGHVNSGLLRRDVSDQTARRKLHRRLGQLLHEANTFMQVVLLATRRSSRCSEVTLLTSGCTPRRPLEATTDHQPLLLSPTTAVPTSEGTPVVSGSGVCGTTFFPRHPTIQKRVKAVRCDSYRPTALPMNVRWATSRCSVGVKVHCCGSLPTLWGCRVPGPSETSENSTTASAGAFRCTACLPGVGMKPIGAFEPSSSDSTRLFNRSAL
mmetsp:Transcript_79211/g.154923  ORF Transcript_79211/g.154923 Transcript_79211/m.154923 type:complete len:384 (-) Transcript_79211:119-1270(-)